MFNLLRNGSSLLCWLVCVAEGLSCAALGPARLSRQTRAWVSCRGELAVGWKRRGELHKSSEMARRIRIEADGGLTSGSLPPSEIRPYLLDLRKRKSSGISITKSFIMVILRGVSSKQSLCFHNLARKRVFSVDTFAVNALARPSLLRTSVPGGALGVPAMNFLFKVPGLPLGTCCCWLLRRIRSLGVFG